MPLLLLLLSLAAGAVAPQAAAPPTIFDLVKTGTPEQGDLVLTNWGQPAQLWMNDGKGRFVEAGRVGDRFNSQGCAIGDVDRDGDPDLFISDYQQGNTSIWLNQLVERRGGR